jgi:hypothetical protein
MGSTPALTLSDIVDVVVLISPESASAPTFNHGLIIGPTAGVVTHNERLASYTSLSALLTAGYTLTEPEYLAAAEYFGQSPAPNLLWVGFQDPTSINNATVGSSGGSGYAVGDIVTITQGGASGGQVQVAAETGGAVTAITLLPLADGTSYSNANNLATVAVSPSVGTGLTIDITGVGESVLTALLNCRNLNSDFYGVMSTAAVTADHEAIAAYVQSATPPMIYFYGTHDSNVPTSATTDVFSYMQSNNYNRVFGQYSTTQGGTYPNNIYCGAAAMGIAMGLNTGLAGSYFTMFAKNEVGVTSEPLTGQQVQYINGASLSTKGKNGNVLSNFANAYTFLWKGTMGSGQFLDLILFLDVLSAQIQYNIMNLLTELPAVPLTDAGEQQLIHCVNQACQYLQQIGFISSGTWNGVTIQLTSTLGIVPGQAIPNGYLAIAAPFSTQSSAARAARQAMPIYLAIICTDAAQSVLVGVYVQS